MPEPELIRLKAGAKQPLQIVSFTIATVAVAVSADAKLASQT